MREKENLNKLCLKDAKIIASKVAREEMSPFVVGSVVLDESYLESEHCWIFFKHPSIVIPKHILRFVAFAVGVQGECRLVYDLRDDPEEMKSHLESLSKYFKESRYRLKNQA